MTKREELEAALAEAEAALVNTVTDASKIDANRAEASANLDRARADCVRTRAALREFTRSISITTSHERGYKLEDKIAQLEAANRKLQRSEANFRAIIANTPDIFFVQDRDLRYELIINPPFGFTEADVIGKTDRDLIGKEDAENLATIKRKVLETGEVVQMEKSLQSLKGQTEFFEGIYVPRFDSTGKTDGLIGYLRNVTERKQAEEATRLLARFPSENPNPVLRVSRDGVLLYANKSSRPVLTEWACAVGQAVPPWWRTFVAEALGTNSRKKVDVEFGHQTYAFTVAPIAEGEYVNLYGRDISDRKLTLDALQQSERRYHHLFDNMHAGLAHCRVIIEDGRPSDVVYIDVNPAFEQLTGLKNVAGRTLTEVIPGIRESNPEVLERYGRVALTGKPETFETYDPSIGIWFLISVFCPEHGYFVAVFENITYRKRAEQALQTTLAEKDVLLREIHHRVKNTLQMTSALLELQSGYIKDEQALVYFKDSQQRIQSMAMIHAQLYQRQSLAQIDFTAYLYTLVDNLRGQYAERCKHVNIIVTAQACILPVDTAIPCGLVINELVSNAMKHAFPAGRAGELRIGLQTVEVGKIVLEVADDGVGLPPDLDINNNSRSFGLRLIRLMIEDQLDGKLTIESSRGTRLLCEIGGHK